MVGVAFKTPLQTRLGICMYKTSLLNRLTIIVQEAALPPHSTTKLRPMKSVHRRSRPTTPLGVSIMFISRFSTKLSVNLAIHITTLLQEMLSRNTQPWKFLSHRRFKRPSDKI